MARAGWPQLRLSSRRSPFTAAKIDTTPAALVIYGLHAINGLAIMAVAGTNLRAARQQLRSEVPAKAPTKSEAPA